jgi:gamma-glutamylcyclotransferase (GGCT)/AIG2-like uncharacterized protein YtfP
MMPSIYLFVYGTLLSSGAAASMLVGCERVTRASVEGTLYDIDGAYPALVLAGTGSVDGEVWCCPPELVYELDRYEGVEDALFRRVAVMVAEYPCWAYVAGPQLARRLTPARRISSGRWVGPIT